MADQTTPQHAQPCQKWDHVEKTVILKTDEILVVVLLLPKNVMLLGGKYLFL